MSNYNDELVLSGLDGSNPLGFLAALGVLAVLNARGSPEVRLGWVRAATWTPRLRVREKTSPQQLADLITAGLQGASVAPEDLQHSKVAEKAYASLKKKLGQKHAEIRERKLRGSDRDEAMKREVEPLQSEADLKRVEWRATLVKAVPSPELALGKDLAITGAEFRAAATDLSRMASARKRTVMDLIAHFGCDACSNAKTRKIEATPFCFISGSGHQYFLETVGALIKCVDSERVRKALFETWHYEDERLSMRWDPIEDRRYALMWSDPTSAGNETRTVGAANLLAYHGLQLLPSMPVSGHLATSGILRRGTRSLFTWPIWTGDLNMESIRTSLAHDGLQQELPDRGRFARIGIAEIYRCERIQVGNPPLHKINFSPTEAA